MIDIVNECSRFLNIKLKQYRYSAITTGLISTNFVDKLWSPLISWISFEIHLFHGHASLLVELEKVFQEQQQQISRS